MKYCKYCGSQIADEAVFCNHCGCQVEPLVTSKNPSATSTTLKIVAQVFMIIGCVTSAFALLIPLCWTVPMTVHYCRSVENNQPVGIGFKVCSLIFVSLVAGILMLCDTEQQ